MRKPTSGGGWPAILYTLKKAHASGGFLRMWKSLRSKNACKTCALGMGGQNGGMVNEAGRFPEVCKKSVQAMAADMQGRIRERFFDEFSFDQLGRFSPRELETAGRITQPLFAAPGDRSYRAIPWEEAFDLAAASLKQATPDDTFFYFSGRSSNEAGFLLQLFARLYGTNNVNNCSFFCHQASGAALAGITGSGTTMLSLEDLEHADLVFIIGGNPASNHPRFMRTLVDLKRRGGKVVVINPLRELGLVNFKVPSDPISLLFGSKIADEYLTPHIGGDIAVLTGLAKATIEAGVTDRQFIEHHTDHWETCRDAIVGASWESLETLGGVSRAQIERVAALYAASRGTIFTWTMGITHHEHGVDNVRAIANLAMIRGMMGRPGAGLLPLRGHSNVQGIGSMGAVPRLKGSIVKAIEERFNVTVPHEQGLDTLGCVQRASEGRVAAAVHLGGNLFGSCPDATYARSALSQIGMTIFLSTTLNTGHIHGRGKQSLILPVLARDEEPQSTTQESMFNFVRLSEGGKRRHDGPLAEVTVISNIARRVLGDSHPANFAGLEDHTAIRSFIADTIPGYGQIKDVDRTKQEFPVAGRLIHTPAFPTANGKAKFYAVAVPPLKGGGAGQLRLMTIRSEGQFNTVVYDEEDIYRGQERRDVILLNPADMKRLGLSVDDRVTVRSTSGEMTDILAREADIREGNAAMYYPEANALVPRAVDEHSRTPAFKNTAVTVRKSGRLNVLHR